MSRPRFALDWDGTLTEDDLYPEIGEFLPGAVNAIRALERIGEVVIWTCRTSSDHYKTETPRSPEAVTEEINAIRAKLREEGLEHLKIWTKPYKPPAAVYIDNKAVAFRGDWDSALEDTLDLIAPTIHTSPIRFREPYRTVMDDYVEARQKEEPLWATEEEREEAIGDDKVFAHTPIASWEFIHGTVGETLAKALGGRATVVTVEDGPGKFRHPSSQRFHEILREWGALHDRKQADYGSLEDPFANVRASESFGLPGWIGCAVRMGDKLKRIQSAIEQYLNHGEVQLANEALVDSFDDLGVYAAIGRTLLEEGVADYLVPLEQQSSATLRA